MPTRRIAHRMGIYTVGAVLACTHLSSCAQVHGLWHPSAAKGAIEAQDDGAEQDTASASVMAMQPEATPTQKASAQDIAQAHAALSHGIAAYHRGDYAAAEQAFKEALVLHPFLAPAHLALGKIYLLRGIAADDRKRLTKGRRMVEMALKLDPKLADAAVYLALFP